MGDPSRIFKTDGFKLPFLPASSLQGDLHELVRALEELGLGFSGSRLSKYRKALEVQPKNMKDYYSVFKGSEIKRMKSVADFEAYLLREVHELQFILQGIETKRICGFEARLNEIFKGSDFSFQDKNKKARNSQFELSIATFFAIGGYSVDLSTETDVVAQKGRTTIFIECKRVSSEKQLGKRFDEAIQQLNSRLPKQGFLKRSYGAVFIDISQLTLATDGLASGYTFEGIRDAVRQEVMKQQQGIHKKASAGLVGSNILLSLHCWIPLAVMIPPMLTSFSTHKQMLKRHANLRELWALQDIYFTLRNSSLQDSRAKIPAWNDLVTRFEIPAGFEFSFDEECLIDKWTGSNKLERKPDDAIAWTMDANKNSEEYSYMELEFVAANLNFLSGDNPANLDEFRLAVLKSLFAQRSMFREMRTHTHEANQ